MRTASRMNSSTTRKPVSPKTHLPDWNCRAGWKTLLNTRGLMWKKLSDAERAEADETKALALMATYPALIKRPVLDTGKKLDRLCAGNL